jgi:hypothetical protein
MPRLFPGGTYMVPDAPDFNWESLEHASGLSFTAPQRAALIAAMHRYLRHLTFQRTGVRMKDVKQQCERIHKHADALVQLLSLHTKNAPSDEDQINLHQAIFSFFPYDIDSNTYVRLLIHLDLGAKKALIRLGEEGQPGRQDKEGLDVAIRAWHAIYLDAGGSGLGCTRSGGSSYTKGPFLDLIDEAFQQIITKFSESPIKDDKPPSRDALAQRILAALKQPRAPQDRDEK